MIGIDVIEQHIADRSLDLLEILLKDKTTGRYIRWCTDNYSSFGEGYQAEQEMVPQLIIASNTQLIQPRVAKSTEEQIKRTRDKAEVFTPTWIVNEQNNLVDDAWFGRSGVFSKSEGNTWKVVRRRVRFPKGKSWQQYVDSKRLEISCGEAPYLVNRYDTVTGDFIPTRDRIGILDRKMRIINENVDNETEWQKWVIRAFQSTYGYEYQGDNVLLARENLLYTYCDNMELKFGKEPTLMQQKKIANIVAWNIWQMDGITMTVPYSFRDPEYSQISLFDIFGEESGLYEKEEQEAVPCKIFDWQSNESIEFRSMIKE
ncbi:MAG: restriction endonuclease subunit M [Oribacterium sp.]|nr:restriction endonuclease subunit M [Oribacterium sp.]